MAVEAVLEAVQEDLPEIADVGQNVVVVSGAVGRNRLVGFEVVASHLRWLPQQSPLHLWKQKKPYGIKMIKIIRTPQGNYSNYYKKVKFQVCKVIFHLLFLVQIGRHPC